MFLIINNNPKNKILLSLKYLITYFENNNLSFILINNCNDIQDILLNEKFKKRIKGIVLSGSNSSNYNKNINRNINFLCLINFDVPILGICYGHQSIGLFYNSELKKHNTKQLGQKELFLKKSPLFYKLKDIEELFVNHNLYLDNIKNNFDIIARDNKNIVYGIQHKNKPIYGVQFHPELSKYVGTQILDNFIKICKFHRSFKK